MVELLESYKESLKRFDQLIDNTKKVSIQSRKETIDIIVEIRKEMSLLCKRFYG